MTTQLDITGSSDNGYTPRQLADFQMAINAAHALIVDPATGQTPFQNNSDDTILQQVVAIVAEAISVCDNAAAWLGRMRDPATALGALLSALVQLNGIIRKAGSPTILNMKLTGAPGTLVPAGSLIAEAAGTRSYATYADVVLDTNGQAEVYAVATETGPDGVRFRMSANIPDYFKVDFSGYERDMALTAMDRLLSQFEGSAVLREFVAAFIENGPQYVYDEIIKFEEANSLYMAKGENLDAIGRIVGQPRVPYAYDDSMWFFTDRAGQGIDQAPAWCSPAPLTSTRAAADGEYRMMIVARIACNFCRFASYPELQYLAEFVTGEKVSWRRVGPMEAEIIVRYGISRSKLGVLTKFATTTYADDIPMIPYPATLNLSSVMYNIGQRVFRTDRGDGWQIDAAPITMSIPIEALED